MSRQGDDVGAPEHLDTAHDLALFDSGVPFLDDWLRKRALANEESGASRTFVMSAAGRVVGYYSLATGAVVPLRATGKARRKMPDPTRVMILGRLAVDKAYQGKGLGVGLLRDAVLRTQQAAAIGRVRGIVLHAISEKARRFYERCGFAVSPVDPMTLTTSMADVERILKER